MVVLAAAAAVGLALRELGRPRGGDAPGGATSSAAAVRDPGPTEVRLAEDVAAHPRAAEVRAVIQRHFDAINEGDYQLWSTTVTRERARGLARDTWQRQYRSTLDGSIVVHRLEARPDDGVLVLLSFTSLQDPADAPPDTPVRCLHWRVSYLLTPESGDLRLAPTSPSTSLHTPC